MNKWRIKKQDGFTLIDMFLIIGVLICIFMIVRKVDDLYDASDRKECYNNQQVLDKVLFEMLTENELELYAILTAYTVFDPSAEMNYRMVIILNPVAMNPFSYFSHFAKEIKLEPPPPYLVLDMTETVFSNRIFCPLRKGKKPSSTTMDYWYMPTHRWYCMHGVYHN